MARYLLLQLQKKKKKGIRPALDLGNLVEWKKKVFFLEGRSQVPDVVVWWDGMCCWCMWLIQAAVRNKSIFNITTVLLEVTHLRAAVQGIFLFLWHFLEVIQLTSLHVWKTQSREWSINARNRLSSVPSSWKSSYQEAWLHLFYFFLFLLLFINVCVGEDDYRDETHFLWLKSERVVQTGEEKSGVTLSQPFST